MKFYFLYNMLRLLYIILKKNSKLFNVLFLFDKAYLYFRYLNTKKYVVKYYKQIYFNIFKDLDVIININNPLIKENPIVQKNIPLITFSYFFLTREKSVYSFLGSESNINKIYLFYLYILFLKGY